MRHDATSIKKSPSVGRVHAAAGVRSLSGYSLVLIRNSKNYASSLVDPASSYMLVSKIKPCMSQCKPY